MVNLERTNLGVLTRALVPEVIEVVTVDLSYLSLALAAPQIEAVAIAAGADLVALVKPMFELGLARPPAEAGQRAKAVEVAAAAFEAAGWQAARSIQSPVPGRRGAIEHLLHLRRAARPPGRWMATAGVPGRLAGPPRGHSASHASLRSHRSAPSSGVATRLGSCSWQSR